MQEQLTAMMHLTSYKLLKFENCIRGSRVAKGLVECDSGLPSQRNKEQTTRKSHAYQINKSLCLCCGLFYAAYSTN